MIITVIVTICVVLFSLVLIEGTLLLFGESKLCDICNFTDKYCRCGKRFNN